MRKLQRHGVRPVYSAQLGPVRDAEYVRRFPFRKAWLPITILALFDIVFLVPAVGAFAQASAEWAKFEDLFDLVAALFLSAWLIGWSIAPLLMTTVLAILLFGRETVRADRAGMEIILGLPGLGLKARHDWRHVRNLRLETPPKKSGKSWRGAHVAFDYGANSGEFGSGLDEEDLDAIRQGLELACGQLIATRDAEPEELHGAWPEGRAQALMSEPADQAEASGNRVTAQASTTSAIILVLVNLVPVAGALFWGWNLGHVLVLYWAESAVIGIFNLCKIAVIARWFALLAGVFFISHFGAFMAVHFLFLYGIFIEGIASSSGGDLGEVAAMFGMLWPAIAGLLISHGYSFFANFIGRGEYRDRSVRTQMSEPYSRIIFMHLVVIIGGGAALVLGDAAPVLVAIIAAKTWVDLRAHLRERRGA
ncbi:MAG: hypothetical protein HKN58_00435 [Xanthomonadales bacterium]|nr:hypothetical protein [Xanthomonadales bacterium]